MFADVLGHESRVAELLRALADGRLPHALLLTGKRGVGKRLVADAVAQAALCDAPDAATGDACGECESCRTFAHGAHPDFDVVVRAEGKRDIGIELVRDLIERLALKGHRGRGRVAVVDDADRLTVAAQNAFLKTLEEPPPGTTLILVSSNAERLLPTVRSRCAILRFGPLEPSHLESFASRRRVDAARVPFALAQGAPGRLLDLAATDVVEARAAVLRFALRPNATTPFELAADLLELADAGARAPDPDDDPDAPDDRPAEEVRERARERLRLYLRLLSAAFRDLRVRALGLDRVPLLHADRDGELTSAAATNHPDAFEAAAEVCDHAVLELYRNVDRALLLEDAGRRIRLELAG